MPGNRAGGLKAAETNKRLYGEDFYKKMGHAGGTAWTNKPKGFAANPALAKEAGRKGGSKTKRGFKWLGDVDKERGRFRNNETGEEVILEYAKPVNK